MKTVIEMAREAELIANEGYQGTGWFWGQDNLERFAELVRADERARMAEQPAPMIRGDIRDGLVDDEPAQQQPAQTDWESVAADQAMTIALLKVKLHGLIDEPPAAYMYEQAKYGPTDLRGQQWSLALSRNKPYTGDDKVRCLRPLYTHPILQTWAGLTDEEVKAIFDSVPIASCQSYAHWRSLVALAIETKLREKNA